MLVDIQIPVAYPKNTLISVSFNAGKLTKLARQDMIAFNGFESVHKWGNPDRTFLQGVQDKPGGKGCTDILTVLIL